MAKRQTTKKVGAVDKSKGTGVAIEHTESLDDSLLPDAEQLERYHKIDPAIVEWIKKTTSIEQKARHKWNFEQIEMAKAGQRRNYQMDRLQAILATLIILAGFGLSGFLLYKGRDLAGTIFAGATIVFGAKAILGFRRPAVRDLPKDSPE